ncbi:MAG: PDZ domain-containing protein [Actinobacteria bacterium]|nr:PDZ domain-containing protein [Actinomycetota bacterium]
MTGLALVYLVPILFLLTSVPTGFVLESPGPSFDLQAELQVEGTETYPTGGEFLLTSVSVREPNLIYHLFSLARGDYRLLEARRFLGEELDPESQDRVDAVLTLLSQATADVLALRESSREVEVRELGALVLGVVEGTPAHGRIEPGEVIVSMDGVSVEGAADLSERIAEVPEGQEVDVGVRKIDWKALGDALERGESIDLSRLLEGETREERLVPVLDRERGRMVIGVYTRDYFTYRSPIHVTWEMESVRGPSAGLMMTLSLLNALLPEDLTRGRKVAGTGEVFLDGSVGPIGGLPMKIRAAELRGAEIFFYPEDNREDLAGVETGMKLIPVSSVEEAVRALRREGE